MDKTFLWQAHNEAYTHTHTHIYIYIDRQTDSQADSMKGRHAHLQMGGKEGRNVAFCCISGKPGWQAIQIYKNKNLKSTDRQIYRQTDKHRQKNRKSGKQIYRKIERQTDRRINR